MPRYVIKVDRHGKQVRVTIPKQIVDELGLRRIAHALCSVRDGQSVLITPFIDEGMLNEEVSGDSTQTD